LQVLLFRHFLTVPKWLDLQQFRTPVSPTNKTDCHDLTEIYILLKVALNTINQTKRKPKLTIKVYLISSHSVGQGVTGQVRWHFRYLQLYNCSRLNLLELCHRNRIPRTMAILENPNKNNKHRIMNRNL
jgi:hypothetical protein